MHWVLQVIPARGRSTFRLLMCAVLAHTAVGCGSKPHASPEVAAVASEARGSVTIRKPAGPPTIGTGTFDQKGNELRVQCATCHTTMPANGAAKLGTQLKTFHTGLNGAHGKLACVSCHNPAAGYGSLRLADGKSLPYTEVMALCAQCHGPQFRDYEHGAHGGMTGHWDLTRGGRERNNCIDCHDPHAPKYPTVAPARGPNDRFLTGGHGRE